MSLQAFDFESLAVRVIVRGEQPWFVAADVCRALEISNSRDAVGSLEDDEKITVANADGNPRNGVPHQFSCISESGLYALIFKSRKAEARRFRKWVTSEVLPAIRREGVYRAEQARADTERGQLARLRRLLLETAEGVKAGAVTPGKAQAIAITGQRYLETLKLEAEAIGYEKVLGLSAGEAGDGILSLPRAKAQHLQGVPQPSMPGAETEEPGLPEETSRGESALEPPQPGPRASASENLQGAREEDLR